MLFYVIFYYMQAFPSIWLPVLFWKLSSLTSTPLLLAKRKLRSGNSSLWQTLAGNSLDLSAFFSSATLWTTSEEVLLLYFDYSRVSPPVLVPHSVSGKVPQHWSTLWTVIVSSLASGYLGYFLLKCHLQSFTICGFLLVIFSVSFFFLLFIITSLY